MMTTDEAFGAMRRFERTECMVQFWASGTPAETFPSLKAAALYLADRATDEPLPSVHVLDPEGEISFNGDALETLIKAAQADAAIE